MYVPVLQERLGTQGKLQECWDAKVELLEMKKRTPLFTFVFKLFPLAFHLIISVA